MRNNILKKLRNSNIPNVYYLWAGLSFALFIALIYTVQINSNEPASSGTAATGTPPALAYASRFATQDLRLNMSRSEVIGKMGKPNWAIIPGDKGPLSLSNASFGLELRWNNPSCRDVKVIFSSPLLRVVGWDDGATYCHMRPKEENYENFSCTLPDRKQFCER